MTGKIRTRIIKNDLPKIINNLQANADEVALRFANEIKDEAQERVPVDTGALKRSIRVVVSQSEPHQFSVVAGGPSTPHRVDYAPYVEFGTRKMVAQPFLGPAGAVVRRRWSRRAVWSGIFTTSRIG